MGNTCERGVLDVAPPGERGERRCRNPIHFAARSSRWGGRVVVAVVVDKEFAGPPWTRIEHASFEAARGRACRVVHDESGLDGGCRPGGLCGGRVEDRHERVVVARRGNRIKMINRIEAAFIRPQPRRGGRDGDTGDDSARGLVENHQLVHVSDKQRISHHIDAIRAGLIVLDKKHWIDRARCRCAAGIGATGTSTSWYWNVVCSGRVRRTVLRPGAARESPRTRRLELGDRHPVV